jgi:hypothetical protein
MVTEVIDADGEPENQHVTIEQIACVRQRHKLTKALVSISDKASTYIPGPDSRLVLGDRRNDRNVL